MTFQEIFNKPGLYKADSFADGICFEVSKEGYLYICEYKNKDSMFPSKENALMYKELLTKDYQVVLNKGQLFKK